MLSPALRALVLLGMCFPLGCSDPCRRLCTEWYNHLEDECGVATITLDDRSRCNDDYRWNSQQERQDCSQALDLLLSYQKSRTDDPNLAPCCTEDTFVSCAQELTP